MLTWSSELTTIPLANKTRILAHIVFVLLLTVMYSLWTLNHNYILQSRLTWGTWECVCTLGFSVFLWCNPHIDRCNRTHWSIDWGGPVMWFYCVSALQGGNVPSRPWRYQWSTSSVESLFCQVSVIGLLDHSNSECSLLLSSISLSLLPLFLLSYPPWWSQYSTICEANAAVEYINTATVEPL